MSDKHLVVVISGHGYGHAAMTAPLINALQAKHPQLKVTIRTGVPQHFIKNKYSPKVHYLREELDFGMQMDSAFSVDQVASLQRYQQAHRDWPQAIEKEMARLQALKADLLISNIAYLPIIAAHRLGIPCIAFGCLNWADIFEHYYSDTPEAQSIYQEMSEAYQACDLLICPQPTMPMPKFTNQQVASCAIPGAARGEEIRQRFGLAPDVKLVLASMGGIPTEWHPERWPELPKVHYLIPDSPALARADISCIDTGEIQMSDIIASVDLMLTKPGYGAFSEAAVNAVPVLYVNRGDWPEHPYLCDWLTQHIPCIEISQTQFYSGEFGGQILDLLNQPRTSTLPENGLTECTQLIDRVFGLN